MAATMEAAMFFFFFFFKKFLEDMSPFCVPCLSCLTCMHVCAHVRVRACMHMRTCVGGAPTHPPPRGVPPKSVKTR